MNFVSKVEIIEIITHSINIKEFTVKLDKDRLYSPGSYVQLTLDIVSASDIWPESRTFSIASYQKGLMRFIIKDVGVYTNRLFNELKVGDFCAIKYPFGDLFNKSIENEKHVFIAGGVGIAPFIGLVEYFKSIDKIENILLLYSAKHERDLLHLSQLQGILGNRLHVFITQENTNHYINGRIKINDLINFAEKSDNIYVCGSKNFSAEITILLKENGYNKIHMDNWM